MIKAAVVKVVVVVKLDHLVVLSRVFYEADMNSTA